MSELVGDLLPRNFNCEDDEVIYMYIHVRRSMFLVDDAL